MAAMCVALSLRGEVWFCFISLIHVDTGENIKITSEYERLRVGYITFTQTVALWFIYMHIYSLNIIYN